MADAKKNPKFEKQDKKRVAAKSTSELEKSLRATRGDFSSRKKAY